MVDDLFDPGRYRTELETLDLPFYLRGYLQSERYFAHARADIVESIQLPSLRSRVQDRVGATIAVHFRRGDYLRLGLDLPWQYYDDALHFALDRVTSPTFVLFSDDRTFLEAASRRVEPYGAVIDAYEITADPIDQLALMAQCDHAIIANSSFAWWGAWLGEQRAPTRPRLVIAPAQYNLGGSLLPSRWAQIQTAAS